MFDKRSTNDSCERKRKRGMKILKWLDKNLETAILIICLVVMTVIMGIQIVSRYAFNSSLAWTEELTRYLFVWSGFISISFAVQKKIAIRIDMLVNLLSQRLKAVAMIVCYLLEFALFAYLIPFSYGYLQKTIATRQVSTAMQIPMGIVILAPLVGFGLSEVRIIQQIMKEVRSFKGGEEECQQ